MEIKRRRFSTGQLRYTRMSRLDEKYSTIYLEREKPSVITYFEYERDNDLYKVIRNYYLIRITREDLEPKYNIDRIGTAEIISFLKEKGIDAYCCFKLNARESYITGVAPDTIQVYVLSPDSFEDLKYTSEEDLATYNNLIKRQKANKLFKDLYLEILRNTLKPLHLDVTIDDYVGEIKFTPESARAFIEEVIQHCNKAGFAFNKENSHMLNWSLSDSDVLRFEIDKLEYIEQNL